MATALSFRTPTASDAKVLAALEFAAGPEVYQYVFDAGGKTAMDFIQYALQFPGGELGYRAHTCVVEGPPEGPAVIVANGVEYSGRDNLRFMLTFLVQILRFYPFPASLGVFLRGLQVERILVPPDGDTHFISHLATDPARRGQGIGEKLIREFFRRGTALGRAKIELDVAETNPLAEALYRRLGFVRLHLRESTLCRNGVKVPGYYRMRLVEALETDGQARADKVKDCCGAPARGVVAFLWFVACSGALSFLAKPLCAL